MPSSNVRGLWRKTESVFKMFAVGVKSQTNEQQKEFTSADKPC